MKRISLAVILISSVLIVLSETSALAGTHAELANRIFVISAVGLGAGEVLLGLSNVLREVKGKKK